MSAAAIGAVAALYLGLLLASYEIARDDSKHSKRFDFATALVLVTVTAFIGALLGKLIAWVLS